VRHVRTILLLVFGLGSVGVVLAARWATQGVSSRTLRDPYTNGPASTPGVAPGGATGTSPSNDACTNFGGRCVLGPGRLGVCVHREGCTQGRCLVCQDQH
jgi:hypothetical protein